MRRSALALVAAAWATGLAPDPVIQPSVWAAEHVVVPDGPYAGDLWSPAEAPYAVEILDALAPHDACTRVTVRKSAQTGLTLVGLAWLGYIASVAPADALVVQPTLDAHARFNRDKLQRMIDNSATIRDRVAPVSSRAGDGSTGSHKRFAGGGITLGIASSAAALRSATVRYVMADEVDEYPADVDGQGDPMDLLAGRQIAYGRDGRWKRLEISTPTLRGLSRIDAAYEAGDQRQWLCPCPHCGGEQALSIEQVQGGEAAPYRAHLVCAANGCVITESERYRMVGSGRWVAQRPEPGRHRSYHVDALMSRLVTLDEIRQQDIASRDDPQKRKAFVNLWLGRAYDGEGEAPPWQDLQRRAAAIGSHALGEIPGWVLFLSGGVDVQAQRLEASVWGWGIGRTGALIEHTVLEGDTAAPEVWAELTSWWARQRETRDGRPLRLEAVGVDSGYRPTMAYDWCRKKGGAQAVKGASSSTPTDWHIGQPRAIYYTPRGRPRKSAATVALVGTWLLKSEIYAALQMEGPRRDGTFPEGFVHLPSGGGDELYQQLVGEQLVRIERRDGRVDYVWRPVPETRNEVLDCAVYARAVAYQYGMGRWTQRQWRDIAAQAAAQAAERRAPQLDLLAPAPAPDSLDRVTAPEPAESSTSLAARFARLNRGSGAS